MSRVERDCDDYAESPTTRRNADEAGERRQVYRRALANDERTTDIGQHHRAARQPDVGSPSGTTSKASSTMNSCLTLYSIAVVVVVSVCPPFELLWRRTEIIHHNYLVALQVPNVGFSVCACKLSFSFRNTKGIRARSTQLQRVRRLHYAALYDEHQ